MQNLFRKISISQKLWTLSISTILFVVILFYFYFIHLSRLQFQESLLKKAGGLVQVASTNLGAGLYLNDRDYVHRVLRGVEADPDVEFIYLVNNSGERIYGYRDRRYRNVIAEFLTTDALQTFTREYLITRQSVFFHDEFQGYLITGFNLDWVNRKIAEQRHKIVLIVSLLGVILMLLTIFISHMIVTPLKTAIQKISRIPDQHKRLSIRLPEEGSDEISRLGHAFNRLVERLDRNLKELEQSNKYIEAFFRLSPIPMIITDPQGKVEVASESACKFFGKSMNEILGLNLEKLLSQDDFHAILNRVKQTDVDINGFITAITVPDGTKKVVEINISILHDQFGMSKSFIIAIVDITENIQTQREILENQAKLHRTNRELEQKTKELEIANEKNKRNARKLNHLIQISQDIIRCSNIGDVIDILVNNTRNLLQAQFSIIYFWDPKEKKLVPTRTYPRHWLKKIRPVQKSEGVIWKTFQENDSYFLNEDSLEEMDFRQLGLPRDESVSLIAVPISEKDYKFGVAIYIQKRNRVFYLEDLHYITTLVHQASITLDKIYLLQALKEKARHLEKAYADLQKSQQQVIQLQKMESLGTLVGGIAHDFNNILGIIIPNIDLIRMHARNDRDIMKRIMIIQDTVERAADLTRQLLMFSRDQDVQLKPISPNQLIVRLAGMFRRTLGKHIEIITDLDPAIPFIKADETRLTQVLINLAVNSRDAMPEGGKLILKTALVPFSPDSTMKKRKYVCISVTDTGEGIAPENLSKIFDPFFTTKSVGKGTGLGLSVVYGIIKSHNGFIDVESEPGQGTTFFIYFEPLKEIPKEPPRKEEDDFLYGDETILIVDDEEMIRESLKDILESLGYHIYTAADGKEALEIVQKNGKIHVAIVDYAMPGMNGIETIRRIREMNASIRILLSSGYAEREQIMNQNVRIDGFLPKPYHIKELARKIKKVLQVQPPVLDSENR